MLSSSELGLADRLGALLFRRRDAIAPFTLILVVLLSRREDFLSGPAFDPWLAVLGTLVITAGLALRIFVIATTAIRRSGVHKDLAVPTLIETGPYACCRNPLYLANVTILIGLGIVFDSRVLLIALAAAFVAIRSLIGAEERVLRERFGQRYDLYCARVPRFVPRRLPPLSVTPPRWRRALRKEHGTIFAAVTAVIVLLAAEHYCRFGTLGHRHGWMLIVAWMLTAFAWAGVRGLKHTGRLADLH